MPACGVPSYAVQQEQVRHMDFDKLVEFLNHSQVRGLRAVGYVGNGEPTASSTIRRIGSGRQRYGNRAKHVHRGHLLDRYMDEVLDHFTYIRVSLDNSTTQFTTRCTTLRGISRRLFAI